MLGNHGPTRTVGPLNQSLAAPATQGPCGLLLILNFSYRADHRNLRSEADLDPDIGDKNTVHIGRYQLDIGPISAIKPIDPRSVRQKIDRYTMPARACVCPDGPPGPVCLHVYE